MPSECPGRPWQKLGADLFLLGSKTYLLVVTPPGMLRLHSSTDVIVHLKSIFARHGIPEVLVSDNGPHFCWLCSLVWIQTRHQQPKVSAE